MFPAQFIFFWHPIDSIRGESPEMATASLQTGRFKYNDGGWYVGQVRTPMSVQTGRQAIALAFQRHCWWLHPGGCIAVLCLVPTSHVALRSRFDVRERYPSSFVR